MKRHTGALPLQKSTIVTPAPGEEIQGKVVVTHDAVLRKVAVDGEGTMVVFFEYDKPPSKDQPSPPKTWQFRLVGTNQPVPDNCEFIDTIFFGPHVFHVYRRIPTSIIAGV